MNMPRARGVRTRTMRMLLLLSCTLVFSLASARADEQTRGVQAALKEKGFYYGQVDGQPGAETMMAVRRYQIRNGLPVTGNADEATLGSLRGRSGEPERPTISAVPPKVAESDRSFLQKAAPKPRAEPQPTPAPVPPHPRFVGRAEPVIQPTPVPVPVITTTPYEEFFAGGPVAGARPEDQAEVVRRAQVMLNRQGYDAGPADGLPGPTTIRAVLDFQDDEGIRRTGRLDAETIDAMGVLARPRRQPSGRRFGGFEVEIDRRGPVFRGIWVR